jgi:hypothetical protein
MKGEMNIQREKAGGTWPCRVPLFLLALILFVLLLVAYLDRFVV